MELAGLWQSLPGGRKGSRRCRLTWPTETNGHSSESAFATRLVGLDDLARNILLAIRPQPFFRTLMRLKLHVPPKVLNCSLGS
jgi:hypothetical protein